MIYKVKLIINNKEYNNIYFIYNKIYQINKYIIYN